VTYNQEDDPNRDRTPTVRHIVVDHADNRVLFTASIDGLGLVGTGATADDAIAGLMTQAIRRGGHVYLDLSPTYTQRAVDAVMYQAHGTGGERERGRS